MTMPSQNIWKCTEMTENWLLGQKKKKKASILPSVWKHLRLHLA